MARRSPTRLTTSASEEAAAAIVDAFAAAALAASPAELRVARRDELEAVFRLRGEEVLARGWREPHHLVDGAERDGYDAAALHLVGVVGDRIVATNRLVFPRVERLLPTEETFGLRIAPFGRVVEGGRLVIAREHRSRPLLAALLGATWRELRVRGYRHYGGTVTPTVLRLYESFGFRTVVLAPPARVWGELRVPACLDLVGSADKLATRVGGDARGGALAAVDTVAPRADEARRAG